jgi:hypothetical protein
MPLAPVHVQHELFELFFHFELPLNINNTNNCSVELAGGGPVSTARTMTVFGENGGIGTKGKRLRHWLCSSHRLVREADSVETCTVTAS